MSSVLELVLVVGARPNFVKAAALMTAFSRRPRLRTTLVHTGQHYDPALSGDFLRELELPEPAVHLRVGSGSHAVQTARVLVRLERWLLGRRADRLLVVGDVNSTMAAALVGAKLRIPVDHVEAGLRSGDRAMPEETNRVVTDAVASLLFVSEPSGVANLRREGHAADGIHHVGNVMIDSLVRFLPRARERAAWRDEGLRPQAYGVVTLHRPSNVDDPARLAALYEALGRIVTSRELPLVFPAHPRTRRPDSPPPGLRVRDPLGYIEFLSLVSGSRLVITDSGGIQEETTFLGIPCLTLRDATERPITVEEGTNTLVGSDPARLVSLAGDVLAGRYKTGSAPSLWDGHAADRIADVLEALA